MAKGIDVSNNNGHIDWPRVAAAGVKYAYAKATEGTGFVDSFYEQNRAGAHAHGIAFGAYHFFQPSEDVAAQVDFFLRVAKPRQGELVPALDYERPPAEPKPAEEFVTRLHRETGYYPVFYSYLSFVVSMRVSAASPLARCPLWLADFTSQRPPTPRPWHEIMIWQHSSTGSVPGVGGAVDLDAGTPPVEEPGKPTHWKMRTRDKHGKKLVDVADRPGEWIQHHPNRKFNGRIIIDPIKPR